MAMEGDGCSLCSEAVSMIEKISLQLKCSQVKTKMQNVEKESLRKHKNDR